MEGKVLSPLFRLCFCLLLFASRISGATFVSLIWNCCWKQSRTTTISRQIKTQCCVGEEASKLMSNRGNWSLKLRSMVSFHAGQELVSVNGGEVDRQTNRAKFSLQAICIYRWQVSHPTRPQDKFRSLWHLTRFSHCSNSSSAAAFPFNGIRKDPHNFTPKKEPSSASSRFNAILIKM